MAEQRAEDKRQRVEGVEKLRSITLGELSVKGQFPYDNRESAMRGNRKRRIADIIRIIVLLVAFSVLLYPTVSNYLYEKNSSRVVSKYDEAVVKLSQAEKEKMLEDARQYNEEMLGNLELLDPFSPVKNEMDARYTSLLDVDGSGMMGYVCIPKIDVELPVYHGTSETVLQSGVGHFEGTSLPVGGENTHTVLTGHRGLPSKLLFTQLDDLETGDVFYVKVLGEKFAYEIDQILTVLPEETDELSIVSGEDYATLVTCTPYAINTHRLLVRGHRVPYEEALAKESDEVDHGLKIPFEVKVLLIAFVVLLAIFIAWMIIRNRRGRRAERTVDKKERHAAISRAGRRRRGRRRKRKH